MQTSLTYEKVVALLPDCVKIIKQKELSDFVAMMMDSVGGLFSLRDAKGPSSKGFQGEGFTAFFGSTAFYII
jgi:hypothetical protein